MRYLYTADGDELFAYAPGRRDFFRAGDDALWAHESHGWLIAAASGEPLAHASQPENPLVPDEFGIGEGLLGFCQVE